MSNEKMDQLGLGQALVDAAGSGNTRLVAKLISEGASVNVAGPLDGRTALMKAAENGLTDTVNALAGTHNANVEAVDRYGWTALMYATYGGHTDVVNLLAGTHNANVDAVDEDGMTALMRAAENGHTDIVNALAGEHDANVEAVDRSGTTALMHAAMLGYTDIVNALAGEHNANVDAVDEDGMTALMQAAEDGHTDIVNALAGYNANLDAVDRFGKTALFYAAENGHAGAVRTLIMLGADAECNGVHSPAEVALEEGHLDICALLGGAGLLAPPFMWGKFGGQADDSSQTDDSYETDDSYDSYDSYDDEHDGSCDCPSCSHGAHCHCAVCNLMMKLADGDHFQAKKAIEALELDVNKPIEGGNRTPLMVACEHGHSNLVDMLVKELKSDVNAVNSKGKTALMFAAEAKMVKMVTTLVNKYKARVDAEDKTGMTALLYAIKARHLDVINVLLGTCKADVDHKGKVRGLRPLIAATMGSEDDETIVNLLCGRHKADVNGSNDIGQTALMVACHDGHKGIVQALVGRHQAKLDSKCKDGKMALHYAAFGGNHEIVDMLLGKYGVDVEACTGAKQTALHIAAKGRSIDTVKLLVNKYDANPTAVDCYGRTPLEYAKEKGNKAIIKVLSERSFVVFVRATEEGDTTSKESDGKECKKKEEIQGDVRLRVNTSTKAQRVIDALCAKKGWRPEDILFSFKGKELSIEASTTIGDLGLESNDCIDARLRISLQDLHNAVIKGDIAEIKRIHGMNAVDLNGMLGGGAALTALMLSIFCDKPEALQILLGLGADVNATNEKGWTALWVATQGKRPNSMSMFRELLTHSPRLETVDKEHGRTVLFLAVEKDSVEQAKALVGAGASLTATDKAGKTPLDYAMEIGNQEMIALLDAANVNPVRPREEKEIARKQREEELARKLAEEEKALNQKFAEEARKRAEEEARQATQRAIIEEAQRKAAAEEKARIEALKAQKRAEEEDRRRKLEEEQAAVRKRDMALKKALEKEEKALRKQKKKEAEQEAKSKLRALVQEKEDIIKAKTARADPPKVLRRPAIDAPTSSDFNPTDPVELLIKFAAEGDMLNITHLINHENVDPNARHPKTGITAVMAAARHGRGSTVRSLVKKKAMIEAVDYDGRTTLMHAILGNQPVMVKDLLDQYRADLSTTDNSGETPLSLAKNLGYETIVGHLVAHKKRFEMSHARDQGKPDKSTNTANHKPDQPKMSDRHGDSRFLHAMDSPGGFFGDLSANTELALGLDAALEDGLDAPPEETFDPIANGRDEWLQQSMFGLDIDNGELNVDGVMEDLLKEVNDITIESYDEINLVDEDAPPPFSNIGLGGLLASAPAPSDNPISGSGLINAMEGSSLFGPMLLTQTDGPDPKVRPPVPMTAGEIESRLRKPPGFDRSPSKARASTQDVDGGQEREWMAALELLFSSLERKVEKLETFRAETENRLRAVTRERDHLRKQVINQDKRLAAYEKRMKTLERKTDQLLSKSVKESAPM